MTVKRLSTFAAGLCVASAALFVDPSGASATPAIPTAAVPPQPVAC